MTTELILISAGESNGRQSSSTFHRSVSRGDLDAVERAETQSVARSYNETIIRFAI
jgi:hypothetical protein